jgi:hypothetical protein
LEQVNYFIKISTLLIIFLIRAQIKEGTLVSAYSELIKEMWQGRNGYVSPWNLKKVIGKVASQVPYSPFSQI